MTKFSLAYITLVLLPASWTAFTPASIAMDGASNSFDIAAPGYQYQFPQDHAAHERFRTEWWYYTGQLTSSAGRRFGFQLTFFRRGIPPEQVRTQPSQWSIQQLYLAHMALTDLENGRFLYADKLSRAGLGKAGAETDRLHVWIDRWSLSSTEDPPLRQKLAAATDAFAIDLSLTPAKPPVVHGQNGVSRKGPATGQASHYYSLTRLTTDGHIRLGADTFAVTGLGWMDHEFGSADLADNIVGWDWFSLQLNDSTELMWYSLRHADGSPDSASGGTLILADGQSRPLTFQDLTVEPLAHWTSQRSGARYPQRWRLTAPSIGLHLDVVSQLADQELDTAHSTQVTYWEGAVSATGQARGAPVTGNGYVEMTGYAERFRQKL
ncbi:MAG: carotenoid 1,2-hydratase [Nitrospira sp.]|nr:carotenoid 1,2-hydratase [Nitrospira sp.]MBS0175175.1 carotenoid 1,2-hydratase [Nitrospira sp.]MCW5778301.1 carotenoid 1,2-hydratase [Nitrospira sp.]HNO34475.1 lipocalin-like domain-containing protein [Nitrospira sp.]